MSDLPRTSSAVIVGGGITGCALAYELTQLGLRDVVVCEKSYLTAGSTGRCGAGIRQQWGLEMNIKLARASCRILETLPEELDYEPGIELKQGGYLILAYGPDQLTQFAKNVELQNRLGVPSRLIDVDEAREIVPYLSPEGLLGATFCPEDGHANPFHTTHAYARAARRAGAQFALATEVTGIRTREGKVVGVETDRGYISTDTVFNAAGSHAAKVAAMAGIDLPVHTQRHQILATEPVGRMLAPMVVSFRHGIYCQQVPHGSFLMGRGDPDEPRGIDLQTSWQFLERMAADIGSILPPLTKLRVVRQWSGGYNVSPDSQPILGSVPGLEGYWMGVGFSGHGFMVAPMATRVLAKMMVGLETEMDISPLELERFERGDLLLEPNVV
ncbi:MAG: NAD(P)/FAD-dependent oxidoreductase [Clostridia bacterium]